MYFQPEYYPRGPSDSAAIRAIAQGKFNSMSESAMISTDRAKFMDWASKLTNE